MISQMTKADSVYAIIVICIATFIGTYIPSLLMDKIEKDKVYVFEITPDTNDNGKHFADLIRENNIPLATYKGYREKGELVLCCKVFSQSKEQSQVIIAMMPEGFQYHIVESKNYGR